MAKTKIDTYIGFCVRARKVTFGAGSIETLKKDVYMIIICGSAAKNTAKLALKYANKFSCPLINCKSGLENVVFKDNCKIIAIRDENLARAIMDSVDENYEIMLGGNN